MEVCYLEGYAYVDEYKFRRDESSGYYLSTKKIGNSRKRLHVYMWEKYNGSIPKGHEIHHKDEDKDNNERENLMCMTRKEHLKWHAENISEERLEKSRENIKIARIKASEWHKSEEGRAWHRSQVHKRFNHKEKNYLNCIVCGNEYTSPKEWSKFCSRKCASQDRRDSGIDNEFRVCVICNDNFEANKYSTRKTCSRPCLSELLSRTNWKRS